MTLSQIMTLALRQMDEDPADVSEYEDVFAVYANQGLRIAVSEYVRPRAVREYRAGETGVVCPDGDVERILSLTRAEGAGEEVPFDRSPFDEAVLTALRNAPVMALCELKARDMLAPTDEPPMLPQEAHCALADFICYRHLSGGSAAKQARAQFFRTQFYQAMSRLRPRGAGSVTRYKNLYTATDVRNVR